MSTTIMPTVAQPSAYYRVILSYKISEETWNSAGKLKLDLHATIPRTVTGVNPDWFKHGGVFGLVHSTPAGSRKIHFRSAWPDDIEAETVKIEIVLMF